MSAPVILVTGTDTEVGKMVTTAAVAAALAAQGMRIAVVKPVQTGLAPGEPGDVDEVARLAGTEGVTTHEFTRLPDPLAPDAAARLAGTSIPTVAEHAERVLEIADRDDVETAVLLTLVWSGIGSAILFYLLKFTLGLRPSEDAEREGLDLSSHGERAYNS